MDFGGKSTLGAADGLISFYYSRARSVLMRAHHSGIQKHDGQVAALEPLQPFQDLPPEPTLDSGTKCM